MRMSMNAFKSILATYAGAYNNTGNISIYSGTPPTAAELESGFDPATRVGRLFTKQMVSGGATTLFTITAPSADIGIISLSNGYFPINGPALSSGVATYALFHHHIASYAQAILVPVGDAANPSALQLNTLQFTAGDNLQVLSFTHKIKRVIPQ